MSREWEDWQDYIREWADLHCYDNNEEPIEDDDDDRWLFRQDDFI